ncbi:hypothetical protein C440_04788 [Haloferax mucosum ATCC BAA-1512]|uniref:Uncharacterized protein n=1 Tax=Haloferax mucosum ATCC BAA-1512 TaxID=662479 RepID=M0II38_9EURY|nr:hypothetical protein [Haloferax mucosum]ELZ96435.1 hypothetical protein C440_04788 [Haloferax mucosum ATCC BAA-1512]
MNDNSAIETVEDIIDEYDASVHHRPTDGITVTAGGEADALSRETAEEIAELIDGELEGYNSFYLSLNDIDGEMSPSSGFVKIRPE